jgi:hypothetical protein
MTALINPNSEYGKSNFSAIFRYWHLCTEANYAQLLHRGAHQYLFLRMLGARAAV